MSLYRTYRPQSFSDVCGQDAVVQALESAAEKGKLAHAYLFAGSRGTGKTSLARIMAKTMMTQGIEDETLKNQIIKGIEEGNMVDLLEIDAASNRGIDDVRDLIAKIQFTPSVAAAKVYIIDEVHMLTKEAFNALLKTLEEPPSYAYFILATTELNKIPVTIQSRCQCFPFRRISEEDIIQRLQFIANQENISIERDALRTIAHSSQGGLRDAISLLDQLRTLETITIDDVAERTGVSGHKETDAIMNALQHSNKKVLIENVRAAEESGIPVDALMRQLLERARTMLHQNIEQNTSTAFPEKMLSVLLDAIRHLRTAPVQGLVLETALLKLCGDTPVAPSEPTPAKEVITQSAPPPPPPAPAPVAEKTPEPAQEKPAIVQATDMSLESIKAQWQNVVEQTSPASVKMSLKNGHIADVSDTAITVSFASAFHRDKVRETEASRKVEEVMEKIFHRQLKLECTLDGSNSSNDNTPSDVVNLADAAAEIF